MTAAARLNRFRKYLSAGLRWYIRCSKGAKSKQEQVSGIPRHIRNTTNSGNNRRPPCAVFSRYIDIFDTVDNGSMMEVRSHPFILHLLTIGFMGQVTQVPWDRYQLNKDKRSRWYPGVQGLTVELVSIKYLAAYKTTWHAWKDDYVSSRLAVGAAAGASSWTTATQVDHKAVSVASTSPWKEGTYQVLAWVERRHLTFAFCLQDSLSNLLSMLTSVTL